MAASYGKSIATASSQSEIKLELEPPAIKNKAQNNYVCKPLKSLNKIFILTILYKKRRWDNFLAQDELYYHCNNFCLAASITQANIISRQVVVMLTRATKMLHFPQHPILQLLFPIFSPGRTSCSQGSGMNIAYTNVLTFQLLYPSQRFHPKQLLWIKPMVLAKNKQSVDNPVTGMKFNTQTCQTSLCALLSSQAFSILFGFFSLYVKTLPALDIPRCRSQ